METNQSNRDSENRRAGDSNLNCRYCRYEAGAKCKMTACASRSNAPSCELRPQGRILSGGDNLALCPRLAGSRGKSAGKRRGDKPQILKTLVEQLIPRLCGARAKCGATTTRWGKRSAACLDNFWRTPHDFCKTAGSGCRPVEGTGKSCSPPDPHHSVQKQIRPCRATRPPMQSRGLRPPTLQMFSGTPGEHLSRD